MFNLRSASLVVGALLIFFLVNLAQAQAPDNSGETEPPSSPSSLESMSLEDLLQVKIQGGSREKKTLLNTASIVTIVTAEEISRSGARDLNDVLSLVPGISFATDTQGVIGIAVRGSWANEGKVLLLIDGEEMNDLAFSGLLMGHHYPSEAIERVEVIRGPGSAAYGGYAELAMINIISKNADALKGGVAQVRYGQTASTYSERDISLGYGHTFRDWKFTGFFDIGESQQSDRNYTDTTGTNLNFQGASNRNPIFLNLGANNDIWSFRFIYDRYNTTDQTGYGTNTYIPYPTDWETLDLGVRANLPVSESFTLIPEFHLKQQEPWAVSIPNQSASTALYYNVTLQQANFGLAGRKEFSADLNLHFGYQGELQQAFDASSGGSYGVLFPNGMQSFSLYQNSVFTEINWETPLASITLGGRYQSQNYGGSAFVPRFSAVRQFGGFHIKALYSAGFREPGIENLRDNPALTAEKTQTGELEFGYMFTPEVFSTINFYSTYLSSPIVYTYSGVVQTYLNETSAGTYGLEYDFRIKRQVLSFDFNYSYFHNRRDEPADYQVPGQSNSLLGMANHKAVLNSSVRILSERDHLNFTEVFFSPRYGYDYDANSPSGVSVHSFRSVFLTNFFFEHSDFLVKNLTLGLGVFNFLNQDYRLIQPYDGSHPPLPTSSRDWVAQLNYRANLD